MWHSGAKLGERGIIIIIIICFWKHSLRTDCYEAVSAVKSQVFSK